MKTILLPWRNDTFTDRICSRRLNDGNIVAAIYRRPNKIKIGIYGNFRDEISNVLNLEFSSVEDAKIEADSILKKYYCLLSERLESML